MLPPTASFWWRWHGIGDGVRGNLRLMPYGALVTIGGWRWACSIGVTFVAFGAVFRLMRLTGLGGGMEMRMRRVQETVQNTVLVRWSDVLQCTSVALDDWTRGSELKYTPRVVRLSYHDVRGSWGFYSEVLLQPACLARACCGFMMCDWLLRYIVDVAYPHCHQLHVWHGRRAVHSNSRHAWYLQQLGRDTVNSVSARAAPTTSQTRFPTPHRIHHRSVSSVG
ncbi:hypothetical protein EJ06DRAFT_230979 [Trichodelitschia bisporula]|uniref:Uncharacterized protein n=1 Tax=Trichodelitschia bisporula TaxID=703511 RepID=A0A6G1HLI2_9PEZI|nr:hypothetical protein EJ06DRAFT_230979 [Trichodelitschia bisporula]